DDLLEELVAGPRADRRAAGANSPGIGLPALGSNELARAHDGAPAELAIEPDAHARPGLAQPGEDAPTGERVLEVMQDARALDEIEALRQSAHRQDVRLPVFDVSQAKLDGLALRVRQARQAEVDRQHSCIRGAQRSRDGV